jgi:VCBS repeat-containing protein
MSADLIDKATGNTVHIATNDMTLSTPGVVRLDLDRSQVAVLEKQGSNLVVHLANGETIHVANFYAEARGVGSQLVLRDADQKLWLANTAAPAGAAHFSLVKDLDHLNDDDDKGSGGGGGALMPVLLGVAGAGGIAAAVGSGGGGSKGGNNSSPPASPPDTTAPDRPTAAFSANGASVTGTGEAGATIQIRDAAGNVIGTGTVGANGNYAVTLTHPDTNGEHVTVTQADTGGNVSLPVTAIAPDLTAPPAPTGETNAAGTIVAGAGEAGATVTIRDASGAVIGTGTVDGTGHYSVTLASPHIDGVPLSIVQADAAGNVSPAASVATPDLVAPAAPTASVDPDGGHVTGTGEPGATVTVKGPDGQPIGTAVVDGGGHYTVPLPPGDSDGGTLTVTQTDPAGNTSPPTSVTTPDLVAPDAPTATVAPDGASVTGTGEPGATVTITDDHGTVLGTATVGTDGSYTTTLTVPQGNGETLEVSQADPAGNVSPQTAVTAPDFTAPAAPTATVSADGHDVTGTGEPGAIVTITTPAGVVLGTGTVATDGSYTVTLGIPQANGETIRATETDAAGNVSPPTLATAPDITPPAAPVASLDATGTVVSGSGEPGATITVRDPANAVIGTGSIDAQGHYAVILSTPQINSQLLSVVQADAAANVSPPASLTAPDLTAPAAPAGTVAADGGSVTGTGEPGATLTVHDPVGAAIGTVVVAGDGTFSVALTTPQINGQALELTQTDPAGNVSPPASATAPDLVLNDSPDAPTAIVAADGASVSGTGQIGATVTVTAPGGVVIGTATVDGSGNYTAMLSSPEVNGETLHVTQTDGDGDVSPPATAIAPDLTAPGVPTAAIDATGQVVSGTGEVGATIHVTDSAGVVIGTATVGANGAYSAVLGTPQVNGEALGVTQADGAGNVSPPAAVTAPDYTAPAAPTIVVSADGTIVTGTGEVGAHVSITNAAGTVIGTATVAGDGSYAAILSTPQVNGEHLSAVETDAAGNASPPASATAPDLTAPSAPTAAVDASGSHVIGTGEPGATVTVRDPAGTVIGTATVAANGGYTATLTTPELNGQVLHVTQADAAGNVSTPVDALAPDTTAPVGLTAAIDATGTMVSGTGEAGATVTIRDPAGVAIGTATVAANGSYSTTLSTPQGNGEILHVVQADATGNASPPVSVTAPDFTAPAAPTASVSVDGLDVTGTGEPGATVTIRDPAGTAIGTALVAADGHYAVTLTTPQTNGELLSARQADAAGNASPSVAAAAPDITAPSAPLAAVNATGAIVSGTGEAGATVTVRDPSGTVIGTAAVAANGSYAVSLTTAQANGETVQVNQTDHAGNNSASTPALAPDITAPVAPALAISADGGTATGIGEPGALVTITTPAGVVLGAGTVAGDGTYSVTLATPQANGETVRATEADAAGNVSAPTIAVAPDITAPATPAASLNATGTIVSGSGEPGATVTVRDPANAVIGTGIVDAQGHYSVVLSAPQIDSQVLHVAQADAAANVSPTVSLTAPDLTAPLAPAGVVAADGLSIHGTGEAGATVTITDPVGATIGTALVAGDGTFNATLSVPQTNGQILDLTQADAAGNISPPATATAPDLVLNDSPDAPTAIVAADGASVTGTGQIGATVTVTGPGGTTIGTATVDGTGNYTATLSTPEVNGETLRVTQTDGDGDVSPPTIAIAPDLTAPTAPTAAIDAAGQVVSGIGEAGATIHVTGAGGAVIGTTTVTANGNYTAVLTATQVNGEHLSVTQADAAGNISPPVAVTAPDYTAPAAPTIAVSADGTTVTGIGEPGAHVTITNVAGTVIGTATVAGDGSYSAALTSPQVNGEHLSAVEADPAGNVSPPATATAPDITAPAAPTATVDTSGALVTGTGEAGATVTVRDPLGTAIGTAVVAANGTYSATLSTPELNGQLLHVSQADAAGNVSPSTSALAPDVTAPAAPTASVSGDGTTVTGLGEAGATVHVTDPLGNVLGTAIVAGDGTYHATLTTPQANGQVVDVTQSDPAGNLSPVTLATAPDITPPAPPTAVAINEAGTIVTGHGEPGATAEVRDAGGVVLGTGTVAANGSFAITLATPETAGETLSISQHDPAGNQSGAVPLVAPFDISAFDNHATASIDLVPTTANENLGTANYLALVSLGLLNLDAQVLATPNVQFTVQPGHSLDASFTYDALLSIGALSNYSVAIQKFDGTNWVALDGPGNNTLLQLSLLGGNLVSTDTLGPGEYRAFVTFNGVAGVGLLGGLSVTGVDNDYLHVAAITPATATGNVITDPGTGGAVDIVSPQTHLSSITVGSATTAVTADHTIVHGAWGTLNINLDGSYTYTPDASAAAIGKTDTFTYTLIDGSDGELEHATLSIAIGSPDVTAAPVAANDAGVVAATFDHVVTTIPAALDASFTTPTAIVLTGAKIGSVSDSFTVGPNSTADVTLSAIRQGGLSVLPSYTITVTDAHGTVVGTLTQTAVAGLPLGSGVSLTLDDLPSGTYHYTVSSTNVLGTGYGTSIYVGETVTHLDQYTLSSAGTVEGHLLANDTTGSAFATLQMQSGGGFVAVGDTPLSITGAHGTLTVDAAGDYSYHPSASLGYSASDPVDSFIYQIVQPNGEVATARLDVTIDINNGQSSFSSSMAVLSVDSLASGHGLAETVPLSMLSGEPATTGATDAGAPPHPSFSLSESDGSVTELLGRFLNDQHSIVAPDTPAPAPSDHATVDLAPAPVPDDPLSYLAPSNDSEHERLALLHAA